MCQKYIRPAVHTFFIYAIHLLRGNSRSCIFSDYAQNLPVYAATQAAINIQNTSAVAVAMEHFPPFGH